MLCSVKWNVFVSRTLAEIDMPQLFDGNVPKHAGCTQKCLFPSRARCSRRLLSQRNTALVLFCCIVLLRAVSVYGISLNGDVIQENWGHGLCQNWKYVRSRSFWFSRMSCASHYYLLSWWKHPANKSRLEITCIQYVSSDHLSLYHAWWRILYHLGDKSWVELVFM